VGSVLSAFSRWSLLSWRSSGAIKSAGRGTAGPAGRPRLSKAFGLPKTLQPSNGFSRRGDAR
jgi:hypothetical protein